MLKQIKRVNLLLFCGVLSCTSNKKELETLDTKLETKGATPTEEIGMNKEGEAIVKKENSASSALVTLEHVNENLKLDLKQQFFLLRECRETLSLSKNGGTGEYPELSNFDQLEAKYDRTSQLGLVEGQIKVVETSDLKERIAAHQSFQTELSTFLRTVKKEKEKCLFQIKEAQGISE